MELLIQLLLMAFAALTVSQLVGVLARGAAVSFVLVVFLITAVWSFFPAKKKVVELAYSDDADLEELLKRICGNDFFAE